MIRLNLKEKLPELKYLCTVLNRLSIQGNSTTVKIKHSMNRYYVQIEVHRGRKYSFISVRRPIAEVDSETKAEISKISANDILSFETDDEGNFININIYKQFNQIPYQQEMPVPPTFILSALDCKSDIIDVINYKFILRKNFNEMEILKNIFNIFLRKNYFCMMSLRKEKHLTINFFEPKETQPTISVGIGLWIPKKNSKLYNFLGKTYYENSIMKFNQISSRTTFTGMFCINEILERPALEFRAILEQPNK